MKKIFLLLAIILGFSFNINAEKAEITGQKDKFVDYEVIHNSSNSRGHSYTIKFKNDNDFSVILSILKPKGCSNYSAEYGIWILAYDTKEVVVLTDVEPYGWYIAFRES
ncbi:MAG: hypothetical protein E7083_01215 [Bacteroidales bacterium]|nr:hypothetical protein [Bacteroidales bacterium]